MPRSSRPSAVALVLLGLAATCAASALPPLLGAWLAGPPAQGRALPRHSAVARCAGGGKAAKGTADDFTVNEEIRATEVRIIGEWNLETNQMDEVNEVLSTREAVAKAKDRGQDLVLVNEDRDPPLVKIVDVGKYAYDQKKLLKEKTREQKVPKMKEVKMSYTIGDHDLFTKLRNVEKWLQNQKQQVRVTIVMKGRTRMFERQARDVLVRVREEVAAFGKAVGGDKNGDPIKKDGRGDLYMQINAGPDPTILKKIIEEGKANAKMAAKPSTDEDEDDDDDEGDADSSDPLGEDEASIMAEIEEMKQELLDCGIKPGQLDAQPEMRELEDRLRQVRAKMSSAAFGTRSAGSETAGAFALGLCSVAFAAARLRPRRLRRLQTASSCWASAA